MLSNHIKMGLNVSLLYVRSLRVEFQNPKGRTSLQHLLPLCFSWGASSRPLAHALPGLSYGRGGYWIIYLSVLSI